MIFGKEDAENEDLAQTVSNIFEDLGEKPLIIEVRRIGTVKTDKCRPIIKVNLFATSTLCNLNYSWS